jgi:flagellar motility protein MotE (MotC chaperone)
MNDKTATLSRGAAEKTAASVKGANALGSAKVGDAPKKKKKKKRAPLFIFLGILIALIAAFVFLVAQFNVFGFRDKVFDFLYTLNPTYETVLQYEATIRERESNANARIEEIEVVEAQQAEQAAALDRRRVELDEREAAIKAQRDLPVYRRPLDDQALADMVAISAVYANMDPTEAASVMSKLFTVEDMAAVIYYMDAEKAALIMEQMEDSVAAGITDKLLRY